jgi:hypothetical protein
MRDPLLDVLAFLVGFALGYLGFGLMLYVFVWGGI